MARPVVDLPQPLSPTRPSVSPRSQREADAVDRLDGRDLAPEQHALREREVHLEVLDAQDLVAAPRHRTRQRCGAAQALKQALRWRSPTALERRARRCGRCRRRRGSAARRRSRRQAREVGRLAVDRHQRAAGIAVEARHGGHQAARVGMARRACRARAPARSRRCARRTSRRRDRRSAPPRRDRA